MEVWKVSYSNNLVHCTKELASIQNKLGYFISISSRSHNEISAVPACKSRSALIAKLSDAELISSSIFKCLLVA